MVEGLTFFRDIESEGPAITDFVDLRAKGMTNFLSEMDIDLIGYLHRDLELFSIFQPLPAYERTNGHDRAG